MSESNSYALKYMTSISKNVSVDEWDDIINKYNNTNNSTIKIRPVDVKSSTYINFNKENFKEDPKFKVVYHVWISKYKNIFAKTFVLNWSKEFLAIKKLKIPRNVSSDVSGEGIDGTFNKKELQKTSQLDFRVEKVIKRKGDKLYVKQKGYDNSFNSWIYKKDIFIKNDLLSKITYS